MLDKIPAPELFDHALGKKWGPRAFRVTFIVVLLMLFGAFIWGLVAGVRAILSSDKEATIGAPIAAVAPQPSSDSECDNLAKSCPAGTTTVLCRADLHDAERGVFSMNSHVCIIDLKTHRVGTAVEIFNE
jgi:hypothetical protein